MAQQARRVAVVAVAVLISLGASAEEYYVAPSGKGKDATKEKPAKDLGNLVAKLKDGDTVHIAAGIYLGRDESGSDTLGVAVKLLGGYCEGFATRDPWGACRTVFSGTNDLKGTTLYRLIIEPRTCASEVVVDGIIFDHGARNRYKDEKKLLILRKADMGKNENATPESGAIKLKGGPKCRLVVKNNVVMNTAPTGGAIAVQPGQDGSALIDNNLVINNTGEGIFAMSMFHPRDGKGLPAFTITNNTVLFSWKHDAIATYGGNGLKLDTDLTLLAANNVFAFGDYGGIDNIKLAKGITLKDNLLTGNKLYDYREFNKQSKVSELEDEADQLKDSTGNVSEVINVPVAARWAELWAGRKEISRAEVDAKAKASNSSANALRGMLGLPLQAKGVALDADVWLHRIELDEALPAGLAKYKEKYGCQKP
jgi:hypothetical protein